MKENGQDGSLVHLEDTKTGRIGKKGIKRVEYMVTFDHFHSARHM